MKKMSGRDAAPMSRRALLSLIGSAAGGAAMYQAMASLGHAARVALQRSDQARGRSEGRIGPDSRRRARRLVGGLRAAQGRLQGAGARISRARRRAELDAARRRHLCGARRCRAEVRVRPRATTSIPVHGAFPITTMRSSTIASGWAWRWSLSSRSTTTPICIRSRPSAASRSASATSIPTSRAA